MRRTAFFASTANSLACLALPRPRPLESPLKHLIVPPDRYAETAWIAQNVTTGANLSLETRRQRKDGSLVEVLVSTAPVVLHGKRIGGYASYRDISEQKRAEELNAALYAIAARSQSAEDLQQFYASIHNIVGQMMYARNFYIAILRSAISVAQLSLFCRRGRRELQNPSASAAA